MAHNKKIKVLLADDDADFMEQMTLTLTAQGYTVISADTEADARRLIDSENFQLAILDLMMENKDSGFVLAHYIKKKNPQLPVIIVTAVTHDTGMRFTRTTPEEKQWIKADVILEKDIRHEQLKGEIERLLEK